MKQIVFTVLKGNHEIEISSKSLLVDVEDSRFVCSSDRLFEKMHRLTVKYNEQNIAVLFEIG